MSRIVALYTMPNSSYWKILGEHNCYGEDRDARKYKGNAVIIAHPPCKHYSNTGLRTFANKCPKIKSCARIAVWQVRKNGGVLEHPKFSRLWNRCYLPKPRYYHIVDNEKCYYAFSDKDKYGGWTLEVRQFDFGHIAQKKTWIYIVGDIYINDINHLLPKHREGQPISPFLNSKHWVNKREYTTSQKRKYRIYTPDKFRNFLLMIANKIYLTNQK